MSARDFDACREMAAVCDRIAAADPDISPRDFLRAFGLQVARIDLGVAGLVDLARGGSNVISGRGFRPEFDDGSVGQARHFAGTAVSVLFLGSRMAEVVSRGVLDRPGTPDGRLSAAAVEFARLLLDGTLPPVQASEWIQSELCETVDSRSASRINPANRP